jgi:lipid-A-disaccharide synthase
MSASKASSVKSLPVPKSGSVDLLIIAGEHSGDEHAARVMRELRQKQPGLRICALGGPELESAGAQLLHDMTATSVVGFVEVLKHYSFFKALFDATLAWIEKYRPRAVCFVDYPGFNLRLAAELRKRGLSAKGGGALKMLYYISPQIWAWKPKRRFTMARDLDAMAVIFPFEPDCYKDTDLPAEFVGHPFLASDYQAPVRHDPAGPILLLPGSRVQAVSRIFPLLLAGFAEHRKTRLEAKAVVLFPSAEVLTAARKVLSKWSGLEGAVVLRENAGCTAASAVLTSSGTMSLHCALAGIPGAVVYKTKTLTYFLARWLVSIDYIGMANLLLKDPMYPEFIQGAATPAALAEQLRLCTADADRLAKTQAQARRLRTLLAQPAKGTAADWLARHLAG